MIKAIVKTTAKIKPYSFTPAIPKNAVLIVFERCVRLQSTAKVKQAKKVSPSYLLGFLGATENLTLAELERAYPHFDKLVKASLPKGDLWLYAKSDTPIVKNMTRLKISLADYITRSYFFRKEPIHDMDAQPLKNVFHRVNNYLEEYYTITEVETELRKHAANQGFNLDTCITYLI